jgi:HEAT repeat protein
MNRVMSFLMALGAGGAALLSTGCVEVERHEFEELTAKLDKVEMEMKNKNELQVHLYNELVTKHGALTKQVTELDMLLRALQASATRLEESVKMIKAPRVDPDPKQGDGPAKTPTVGEKIEDILLHVQTVLGELRQGKVKTDEAAAQLRPYAKDATPLVLNELAGAVTKFEYAKQLESILSKFPPADLKVPFQKALTQRGLRESAARVVGQTKDVELAKVLEEHIDSNDEDFRLTIGESLVQCRNAKGVPILIANLRSSEVTTRTIAIAALKRLNRGDDFGYRAQLAAEQNGAPLKSWEEWAEKFGKTIFE